MRSKPQRNFSRLYRVGKFGRRRLASKRLRNRSHDKVDEIQSSQVGQHPKGFKFPRPAWIQAFAAVAVVALTGAIALVSCQQKEISKTANEILQNQSQINESNFKHQIRAYIAVRSLDELWAPADGGQIYLFLRNAGQTPADEISFAAGLEPREHFPKSSEFDNFPHPEIIDLLEPNTESRQPLLITGHRKLNQNEISDLNKGNRINYFVWGTISYNDVFGERHRTYFCYSFHGLKHYQSEPNPVNNGFRLGNRRFCPHPKNY